MKYQNIVSGTIFKIAYTCNVILKLSYYLFFKKGQLKQAFFWQSIDDKSKPIPWYTYPCISFLETVDFSNKVVFEFGSGNSTKWWANNAKSVVSVEHNSSWFNSIKDEMPKNVTYILKEKMKSYINSIELYDNKFDVIIVDGEWRLECIAIATSKLAKDGILILDNSDRYNTSLQNISKRIGGSVIGFTGLGPINAYEWTTTIFLNPFSKLILKVRENAQY